MKITMGAVCIAIAAMLSACGGGSDSSSAMVASPVPADRFDGNLVGQNTPPSADNFVKFGNYPFNGGALFAFDTSFPDSAHSQLLMSSAPAWTGNMRITNNTTGASVVLSKSSNPSNPGSIAWVGDNTPNLVRNGVTDSFTVVATN